MQEVWRHIPSLPTHEASSLGRIRTIPTVKAMPKGGARVYGGKPWLGVWAPDTKRYIVQVKGVGTRKVHRLVCEAFHGPAPDGAVCMHLNEDSSDNRPENLAWGTQQENLNAPGFLEYCRSRTGANNPYIKGRAA